MNRRLAAVVLVSSVIAGSGPVRAQASWQRAQELYVSADYAGALAVLGELDPSATGSDAAEAARYRLLCLLALGRLDEAQTSAKVLVTLDPFLRLGDNDASPGVRARFDEWRMEMLPDLAMRTFTEARQAYGRREYRAATDALARVDRLLDEIERQPGEPRAIIKDLRTLAEAFGDLTRASSEEPRREVADPAPGGDRSEPRRSAPQSRVATRVYTKSDADVRPPKALAQELPPWPASIAKSLASVDRGVLEVVISPEGVVESVIIRTGIHPQYDSLLVAAAQEWRYEPARLGGRAVPFAQTLELVVDRR